MSLGVFVPGGPLPVPFAASYRVGPTLENPTSGSPTVTLYPPTGSPAFSANPTGATSFTLTLTETATGIWGLNWTPPEDCPLGVWSYIYPPVSYGGFTGNPSALDTFMVSTTITITPGLPIQTSYCTPADLRLRLRTLTETLYPDDVLQPFCDQMSSRIDATLRQRYVVPFSIPCDPLITRICADLAVAIPAAILYQGDGSREEPTLARSLRVNALADLRELALPDKNGRYSMSLNAVERSTMGARPGGNRCGPHLAGWDGYSDEWFTYAERGIDALLGAPLPFFAL